MQLTRPPCVLLGLLATLGARPAGADSPVEIERAATATISVYADGDRVTVVTPSAHLAVPIGGRATVEANALVDVVSAASVDVTSQASPRAFDEQRGELEVTATFALHPRFALGAQATGSIEKDYRSLHLGLGAHLDLVERRTSLELTYTGALDQVGRYGDPAFARGRSGHRLLVAITRVIDRRTLLDLVADGELVSGYQASPYRYVPIESPSGERLYSLAEALPELRLKGALLGRLRRAFGRRLFFHLDYRFAGDSWGLTSHTGSSRLLGTFGRITVGLELRGYYQTAARFHRARYVDDGAGAPGWRTRDRTLGRMGDLTLRGSVEAALGPGPAGEPVRLTAAVALLRFWFLDFPLQPQRDAVIANLSLDLPF